MPASCATADIEWVSRYSVSAGFSESTPSHNSRTLVAPVTIPQQPLVEFSGRQPRQFRLEVDRARYFLARQRLAAKRDQFLCEFRARLDPGHRLYHRFDFLAEIGIGDAEHGGVRDL